MKKTILVVDDEPEIADLIEVYLTTDEFQVIKCYDGTEALNMIETKHLDMAVLDVMLPGVDGFTLCRKIRESHYYPVIMLTARTEDMDKITGLTIGADDYITKPFHPLELLARVKTQFRRADQYNARMHDEKEQQAEPTESDRIDIRGLSISGETHHCTLNGKELSLTPREFAILWYLCQNRGKVISSEELFEQIWGESSLESNNTVMAHIGRIREKMKDSGRRPKYIKTVWGVGYQIEE